MNKYARVATAEQTRFHTCHWPGCNKQVHPALWGCKPHWFKLPQRIRNQIWANYRTGQEESLNVSKGYYVGCHHKTKSRTHPLGNIPTPELRNARKHIHRILDPLWQSGKHKRKTLYAIISEMVGWKYHTSKLRTVEEARRVYKIIQEIAA